MNKKLKNIKRYYNKLKKEINQVIKNLVNYKNISTRVENLT